MKPKIETLLSPAVQRRKDAGEDWFWACGYDSPAGDKFVIANGQSEMWIRVRREISAKEQCCWNPVHRGSEKAEIQHILGLLLNVVEPRQVNRNAFIREAAQIPVFAEFIRSPEFDPNW